MDSLVRKIMGWLGRQITRLRVGNRGRPSGAVVRMTEAQLTLIMPRCPGLHVENYAACMSSAMIEASIVTLTRAAAFLGQIAHESGELRYMEEIGDGLRYEGRADLGNTQPGDGPRFKGRGPIQLTGRANYERYGKVLGVDLVAEPERASHADVGFRVAALYWTDHHCNALADSFQFEEITRQINGGLSHYPQRLEYYHRALEVLGAGIVILAPL